MKVTLLGPGDDAVNVTANFLGARDRGLDAVVGKQGDRQVLFHGLGVAGIGTQLAALLVMPH